MKEILNMLDVLRGSVRHEEMAVMLLIEAATKLDALPDLIGSSIQGSWDRLREEPAYPQLQAAAQMFLGHSRSVRLQALDSMFSGTRGSVPWITTEAADQVADLVAGAASARFSFSWSLHPALHVAVTSREAGSAIEIAFVDIDLLACDIARLCAAVLEVDLSVFRGMPFERLDAFTAEIEIAFPPMGLKLDRKYEIPKRTLDWMGATESARMTTETAAIADLLAQAPNAKGVIGLSAGALFRTVGVEAIAREELINSGRLRAMLDVPSGMVYHETGIQTGVLTMAPEGDARETVRFIDLADPHFSTRTSRGRYEAKRNVSWREAIEAPLESADYARDVPIPEIEEQGRILTASRYLSSAAGKLSAFQERYTVAPLSELVELIRPVSLPKADQGEYIIHETAPGDIGENGLLGQPSRTVSIDRGAMRKARNQQLEPGDVVLSVKGTIGRVGIVPDAVPGANDDEHWAVGQSMMILRPLAGRIKPEVLYEYLSSDVMQEHFATLAGGAVIQAFNMQDLKGLQVPVPSPEEQANTVETFWARQKLYAEIQRVRDQIEIHRASSWPHQDLRA